MGDPWTNPFLGLVVALAICLGVGGLALVVATVAALFLPGP